MLKRWQQLTSKVVFQNPWWTYKLDTFQIPEGVSGEYHYVYTRGSSMVVPITKEGHVVLVNQYRYLCDRESLEFPCGSINEGHTYLQTASLELQEETGYKSRGLLEELGQFNPYNGVTSEICTVYLARDIIQHQGSAKKDETEEFEVIQLSIEEVEEKVYSQEIWDGMTLAAWMLARRKVEEIRVSLT